mmetsp:Transcript_19095/g.33149  ORF Transcript_19095/g.33149 Transcript_19095/m.33149 type:complete len:255 (-) Transcript_19095:699-1463(-)
MQQQCENCPPWGLRLPCKNGARNGICGSCGQMHTFLAEGSPAAKRHLLCIRSSGPLCAGFSHDASSFSAALGHEVTQGLASVHAHVLCLCCSGLGRACPLASGNGRERTSGFDTRPRQDPCPACRSNEALVPAPHLLHILLMVFLGIPPLINGLNVCLALHAQLTCHLLLEDLRILPLVVVMIPDGRLVLRLGAPRAVVLLPEDLQQVGVVDDVRIVRDLDGLRMPVPRAHRLVRGVQGRPASVPDAGCNDAPK